METKLFTSSDGTALPLLVSSIIGAGSRHGFTARAGGVSQPPFDSLNLGWKWGDRAESVDENHRRLAAASGGSTVFRASQVHGTRVLRVRAADDPGVVAGTPADGLCTDDPGVAVSVHVADCTPILLACARTGACAALHAGWRGTVARVALAGVAAMVEQFGCRPKDLRVALGPCIGACCFEVGPEVAAAFIAADSNARDNGSVLSGARKDRVDLRRVQRIQFESAGVLPDNIDASVDCTFCDPDRRFFSFRRAGRATGQMVGFILRA
jgi:polyphenol oxidase